MSGLQTKYFVLKPKGIDRYAEASRKAIVAYAASIESINPELAIELCVWADKEIPPKDVMLAQDYTR